jgi:hypothetical protein
VVVVWPLPVDVVAGLPFVFRTGVGGMPTELLFTTADDVATTAAVEVSIPSSSLLFGVASDGRDDEVFFVGVDSLMWLEIEGAFFEVFSFLFAPQLIPPTTSSFGCALLWSYDDSMGFVRDVAGVDG